MKMKRILAAISAMTLGATMAISASADTASLNIDSDKLLWGDPEDKGNFRIEIFNEYGTTKQDPPITPSDISNVTEMTISFTLAGVPEGDYTAALYFASGDWSIQDQSTTEVSGDGTYSITTNFGEWEPGSPKAANSTVVFVIDIPEMGTNAGISQEEDYDMSIITVSDVSVEMTTPEAEEPESQEPESSEEESAGGDASESAEESSEGESEAAESSEAEESSVAATGSAATDSKEDEEDGLSTGVIAGIVVACVAVIGVIAAVVIKKKK